VFILILIFFAALVTFILIAKNIFIGNTYAFDTKAFAFADAHISPLNTVIMQFFSLLGSHTFLIPANLLLIVWFFFIQKKRWLSIKIPAVALSSLLLMFLLKLFFERPRPSNPLLMQAAGFSFPSGHSLMSITFYGLLFYIIFQNVKNILWRLSLAVLLIFMVLMIGFSRIYLRVHYASDVIAGFCVGIIWLIVSFWILSAIENSRTGRRSNFPGPHNKEANKSFY
ncbi:MAG: phosphatase PAP2 family protein, partial [Ginsengibacter sp.]